MINNYLDQTSNSSMPAPMNVDPSFYEGDIRFEPIEMNGLVTLNDMGTFEKFLQNKESEEGI
jgi:hypothetical protein